MSHIADNITDIYAASSQTLAVQYIYHFILLYHTLNTPITLDLKNFLATNKEEACGMESRKTERGLELG